MKFLLTVVVLCLVCHSVLSVKSKKKASKDVNSAPDPKAKNVTTTKPPVVKSQKELLGSFGTFGMPKSNTTAPAVKEKSQKELLGSFGIFGLSKPSEKSTGKTDKINTATVTDKSPKAVVAPPVDSHTKAPAQPEEQKCSSVDMCLTMNGICNRGKCIHTDPTCMNDIKCTCDAGYTGQFCSTAIKDIPEITTTVEPTTQSTPATPTTTTTTQKHTSTQATTTTAKNNGKQHVNGNVNTNVLGQQAGSVSGNPNSNTIGSGVGSDTAAKGTVVTNNGIKDSKIGNGKKDVGRNTGPESTQGKTTVNNKADQVSKKGSKDTVSNNKSYRKGPEASFVSDNSPISLNTTVKPQQIKTGKVSIISTLKDIVTFATVSVKNTFINVVKQQTPRVQIDTSSKQSMSNSGGKTLGKTIKPEVTTQAAFTKVVIIDPSKNMTVNSSSKVDIKKTDTMMVTKTNGTVEIKNKSIKTAKSSNMINTSNEKGSKKTNTRNEKTTKSTSKNKNSKRKKTNQNTKSEVKTNGSAPSAKVIDNNKSWNKKKTGSKKGNNKGNNNGQKRNNTVSITSSDKSKLNDNIGKLFAKTKNNLASSATPV